MTERKNPASSLASGVSRIKELSNGLDSIKDTEHSASQALLYNDYAMRDKLKALLLPEESLIASSVCLSPPPSMQSEALTQLLKVL